jgi:hypothetical protein
MSYEKLRADQNPNTFMNSDNKRELFEASAVNSGQEKRRDGGSSEMSWAMSQR